MRSEDCVIVWGAREPGEVEIEADGPMGSAKSVPCTELRERVGWATSAEPSLTAVGTAKF